MFCLLQLPAPRPVLAARSDGPIPRRSGRSPQRRSKTDGETGLLWEDVDLVIQNVEQHRRDAALVGDLEPATRRHERTNVRPADWGTDLSKMGTTGLRAYHSISSKRPRGKKGEGASPPDRLAPIDTDEKVQIVFVSAEVAPYSKTGGLGDVVGSLPFALAKRGHRVMIVTPRYLNGSPYPTADVSDTDCDVTLDMGHGGQQCVKYYSLQRQGVDVVFVDHACFHRPGHPYGDSCGAFKDNSFRFAVLSMAACEAPLHVLCHEPSTQRRSLYGDRVVFVANDWHTALVPVYLAAKYRPHGVFVTSSCIMAVHNLAHQGIESPAMFHNLGIPESHYGVMEWVAEDGYISMNFLKGGLVTADRIVTVSCMHAFDILRPQGAMGLHPILQCRQEVMNGIINGIDTEEWNPKTDSYIAERYSAEDLSGKVKCKLSLQRELGFRTSSKTPLIGYIGRLDVQKGPDLMLDAAPWMMANRCQVVMLGCDMILMPSRFEPCGLTQQFAIRYGTIPVAHATGGLMDTIEDFNPFGDSIGNGFLFRKPDVDHLIRAVDRALDTFRHDKQGWRKLQSDMGKDFSWSRSAASYEKVIRRSVYQRALQLK